MVTSESDVRNVNQDGQCGCGSPGGNGESLITTDWSSLCHVTCAKCSRLWHLGLGKDMEIIKSNRNETSKSPSPKT